MYYANPVQPYGMSPSAQYGLSIIGQLLNQMYSSGQINMAEYQAISNELNTPDAQNTIANKLTQTYGNFTVNQASVQNSVTNMLIAAVQKCRTQAMQQQPYFQQQQMVYGTAPYQNYGQMNAMSMNQLNTMAPGMQPITYQQQQVPQVQQTPPTTPTPPATQQTTSQQYTQEPSVESTLTQESTESSYCGEAEMEPIPSDKLKKLSDTFNISKIQTLTNRVLINCGKCRVIKNSVAFRLPCHNRSIMLACLEQEPFRDIIFPEDRLFATTIEWHRTIHIPYQKNVRPIQLLDDCCERYRQDKKKIGQAIVDIDRALIAEGASFGAHVELALIEEINRFAPTVFHRLTPDGCNTLRDFDDFKDYHKVLDTLNQAYMSWKKPDAAYKTAGARLMTSIHGRFFNGNRKPYLDPTNPMDVLTFQSDPFLPYRYKGYPLYLVPEDLRDEEFHNYVQEIMSVSMTLVLTHRTLIHNLSLHSDFNSDHVYIPSSKCEPEERILSSIVPGDGLVEIIDINDARQRIRPYAFSLGYDNELVFWRQPLSK